MIAAFCRESKTDQPPAMSRHEVDNFRRDLLRCDGQVALVFAVFVVDHYHHAAGANFLHGIRDRNKRHLIYCSYCTGAPRDTVISRERVIAPRRPPGSATNTTTQPSSRGATVPQWFRLRPAWANRAGHRPCEW